MKNGLQSGQGGIAASTQENERLRKILMELEQKLRTQESERAILKSTVSAPIQMDVNQNVDSSDVARLQDHIRRVRAENENLRKVASKGQFANNRVQVSNRISHQETRREAPRNTIGAVVTTVVGVPAVIRRSVQAAPVRLSAGYVTSNQIVAHQVPLTTIVNTGLRSSYHTPLTTTVVNTGLRSSYNAPLTSTYTSSAIPIAVTTSTVVGVQRPSAGYISTSYAPTTAIIGGPRLSANATTTYIGAPATVGGVRRSSGYATTSYGATGLGGSNIQNTGITGGSTSYVQNGATSNAYPSGGVVRSSQTYNSTGNTGYG